MKQMTGGLFFSITTKRLRSVVTVAVAAIMVAWCGTLAAQDLEPRAYSNSPIGLNFAIAGYGYAEGTVLTDPSLPLENVSNNSHVGVFAYATTFAAFGQSGKFDVVVPYASLAAQGLVNGTLHQRYVTGFADPSFRLSLNFVGAPALTAKEFKDYKQDFIFGASLRVGVPLGQYNEDKLVNIGTHRWSLKPEIGVSKAIGRWAFEVAPAVAFYTDNDEFFGSHTREVSPLYSMQTGVSYTFMPGAWLSLNGGYFSGGQTTIDSVQRDDELEGLRFGVTLALPVNRYQSVKLYAVTGYNAERDHDFDGVGIAWQIRWGGGY